MGQLVPQHREHEFTRSDWSDKCWQMVVHEDGHVAVCGRDENDYLHVIIEPDDPRGY